MAAATPPWPVFHLDCRTGSLQESCREGAALIRSRNLLELFDTILDLLGQVLNWHQCLQSQTLMLPHPCLKMMPSDVPGPSPSIRSSGLRHITILRRGHFDHRQVRGSTTPGPDGLEGELR